MFFYGIFIIVIIIEIILTSTIKIRIKNLKLSTEKYNGKLLDKEYQIIFKIFGLQRIKYLEIELTKEKLEKIKNKFKNINIKEVVNNMGEKINIEYKDLKRIKKYTPKLKYINLKANIGIENAWLTSYIVPIISAILGVALNKQLSESNENKFIINPVYVNKNLLNLELHCIFETKVIHIIYIIYILNKRRRDDKNVRTSNRRSYGYSYE